MNTAALPPKRIALRAPYDRLVFDREDGVYRGALYRIVKQHSREYKVRDTAKGKTLSDMLLSLFGEISASSYAREIYNYITATEWGRELV